MTREQDRPGHDDQPSRPERPGEHDASVGATGGGPVVEPGVPTGRPSKGGTVASTPVVPAGPDSREVTLRALDLLEVVAVSPGALDLEAIDMVRRDLEVLDRDTLLRAALGLVMEATRGVWPSAAEAELFRRRVQERRLRMMVGPL